MIKASKVHSAQLNNSGVLFCIGPLRRRLARRRERDRARRAAMTTEERDAAHQLRKERRAAPRQ